jgi:hypothetical protein
MRLLFFSHEKDREREEEFLDMIEDTDVFGTISIASLI